MFKIIYIIAIFFLSLIQPVFTGEFWSNQIPNGTKFRCANCHINPQGGGARNTFGTEVELNFLDNKGNVLWGPELAKKDSDGDGFTNGQELQDPEGLWTAGNPNPGSSSLVSIPGDATSIPPIGSVYDADKLPNNIDISFFTISPNPASLKFNVNYSILKARMVELEIYSTDGIKISTLERNYKSAGSYILNFNLGNISLASGSYICYLKLDDIYAFRKILIIR